MKFITVIQNAVDTLRRQEFFLWGLYISFLIVMILAVLIDFYIDNLNDAYLELFFSIVTLAIFLYWRRSLNNTFALYAIVLIGTLTSYVYIFSNQYTVSIFHIIVPLGYFFLFSLRVSLILTFLHETMVVLLYIANYFLHPGYLVYHHTAIVTASALGSLLMILFGIIYHFSIENSYKRLRRSKQNKGILLHEAHRRVKNNLNIISSMLDLQMPKEADPRMKDAVDKNKNRIKSISLVHEILYRHDDFVEIDVIMFLKKLADTQLKHYDKKAKVTITGDKLNLPIEQIILIGIIVNEMILNSIRYYLNRDHPYIKIKLSKKNIKSWTFEYSDSGTDTIDLDQVRSRESLEIKFIEMIVEKLDAQMTIHSKMGLEYQIEVPMSN